MRYDNILSQPSGRDWSVGYGEDWEVVSPRFGDWTDADIQSWLESEGRDEDLDGDTGLVDFCTEVWDENPDNGVPMMNYSYPVTVLDADEAQRQLMLASVPVTIVFDGNEHVLALTGGGMDLSWEIVEAYMAVGQHPPMHFCDLPTMAGRGESDGDRAILQACIETLMVVRDRASSTIERLDDRYLS